MREFWKKLPKVLDTIGICGAIVFFASFAIGLITEVKEGDSLFKTFNAAMIISMETMFWCSGLPRCIKLIRWMEARRLKRQVSR